MNSLVNKNQDNTKIQTDKQEKQVKNLINSLETTNLEDINVRITYS